MKFYTSYYGNRNLPENMLKAQISTTRPEDYPINFIITSAMPSWDRMVGPHRKGQITDEIYTERYLEKLTRCKSTLDEIIKNLQNLNSDVVFLCYCGKDKFCHRHIFAKFLKDNYNIDVEEY